MKAGRKRSGEPFDVYEDPADSSSDGSGGGSIALSTPLSLLRKPEKEKKIRIGDSFYHCNRSDGPLNF